MLSFSQFSTVFLLFIVSMTYQNYGLSDTVGDLIKYICSYGVIFKYKMKKSLP